MKSFPSASLPVFVQFATMVDVNPQDAIENPEDPSNLQIKAVACNLSKISLGTFWHCFLLIEDSFAEDCFVKI